MEKTQPTASGQHFEGCGTGRDRMDRRIVRAHLISGLSANLPALKSRMCLALARKKASTIATVATWEGYAAATSPNARFLRPRLDRFCAKESPFDRAQINNLPEQD
eukprot:671897-Prorocentrum_minimum.AAC.1